MLQQFYRDVLPSTGAYCLFLAPSKRHVWFDSLDGLVEGTEARATAQGVYFATAAFVEPGSREAANVALRRSFAFDIDAGEEKHAKHGDAVYRTQMGALAALTDWIKAHGIKPTYILSSGAGLHAYFCLDEDVTPQQWLPVAKALKAMALAQELRIDATVTSDLARVLRPPGTLHSSGAPVKILAHGSCAYSLHNLAARVAAFVPPAPVPRKRSLNTEILEAPVGPPKSAEKIRQLCPAMGHAMQLRGDVAEPYWRAMLGVIKFTQEGEDAAHAYSQGHPEYDYDATQAKLDRWTAGPTSCATFEAENPSACAGCAYRGKFKSPIQLGMLSLQELQAQPAPPAAEPVADEAENLPFVDDTPLEAAAAPQVMPWDGYLPEGFFVIKSGGTYRLAAEIQIPIKTGSGEDSVATVKEVFCSVPYWFESWSPAGNDSDEATAMFGYIDPATGRPTRRNMPTRLLARRQDFIIALATQNIQVFPANNRNYTSMENFIRASMERIRAAGQRPKVMSRFGSFYNSKGELVVAQGPYLITADGIYEGVMQDKLRARGDAYTVPLPRDSSGRWGNEVWASHILPRAKRHVDYLNEFYSDPNFRPYQLAISLAIASPLLTFTQGNYYPGSELPGLGFTVSLYSPRSGIGKTSAMAAAALAYGVPNNIVAQLDSHSSTGNARGEVALQAGTMPAFMDEMEDVPPKEMAHLISSIGNGMSKKRMNKDLSITGGEKMTIINVMSTNKSHREIAAADRTESPAVQMRLLEIECSSVQPVSAERSRQETEARAALLDCAGAIGALIHWHMCRADAEELNKAGIECSDIARQKIDGSQDGRLMWRALGAVLMMRRILKGYGLKFFELDVLIDEFKRWHDAGYAFAADGILPSDPDDLLALFLSDIAGNTLVTHGLRRAGRSGNVDVVLNDRTPDNVLARSVLEDRRIYVKADALRDWCYRRKVSHISLINFARDNAIFVPPDFNNPRKVTCTKDLFQGTRIAQGVRVTAFTVDLDKLGRDVDYSHVVTRTSDNVRELVRPESPSRSQMPKSSASS